MMALVTLIEPAADLPWWAGLLVGLVILGSIITAAIWVFNWVTKSWGRW